MSPGATRPLTTIFEFPENSAGHNRKKVCATLGYPYSDKIKAIDGVLNRDDAIDWIINHQANRHNLTPEALSSLRAKHYKQERKKHGAPKENVNAKKQSAQSGHFVEDQSKTREKVAKKYGVGKSTIARDVQYDDGLDKIAEACGESVKQDILKGKTKLTKGQVREAATLDDPEEVEAYVDIIKEESNAPKSKKKKTKTVPRKPMGDKIKFKKCENVSADAKDNIYKLLVK